MNCSVIPSWDYIRNLFLTFCSLAPNKAKMPYKVGLVLGVPCKNWNSHGSGTKTSWFYWHSFSRVPQVPSNKPSPLVLLDKGERCCQCGRPPATKLIIFLILCKLTMKHYQECNIYLYHISLAFSRFWFFFMIEKRS